ncbi:ATP-binding protein [Pantoea sp. Taur]|uniref:ATP-binding protein n=1 Tax=Pantoea sp. Taur TaxID=2576757 RepID=UPI0013551D28|nr:ATP-binding protein [Pantoea sp. Taur]MXP58520.1 transporter substrate-binding domain-containing protein [Pantoea sp. Taur]
MQWITGIIIYLWLSLNAVQAQDIELTPSEQSWIKSHPVITYTFTPHWPQDYIQNGKHIGISREVLDEVQRRTGLTFIYVPAEQALLHPPMMLSGIMRDLIAPQDKERWLLSFPWANTLAVIIGPKQAVRLRTLKQLEGKRVAIDATSEFVPWLQQHFPKIKLQLAPNIIDALQSVEEGHADAALASNIVAFPVVQRHFLHQLAMVAQVPELATGISMAVEPAYPELRDILDRSMEQVTAEQARAMFARWVGEIDLGTPTLLFVAWQYRFPLVIGGIMLLLLIMALYIAIKARKRAQASERSKAEFLAVMSHEIRTPMNAIIASLELLQQKQVSIESQQEYQSLALSSSQDMLELLNNVLDHSKLSQQQVPLFIGPCDISTLLSAVCDSQRLPAERKGLQLNFVPDSTLAQLWLEVDAHRLRQIVNNLLSNAVKFTDQGEITLEASWSSQPSSMLILRVIDTGIGIAAADQQRLFKAWQQAESRGDRLRSGSGLGLYLSRTLARQMKGDLTLLSEEGKGSTFTCTLPLLRTDVPQQSINTALPQVADGYAVLIVEDHPANQQVLAGQLHELGCHYELAVSAELAMQLLEEENYYDAILLDCNLPGKDGYWLAEQIRLFEARHHADPTLLVAISAVSSSEHHARCKSSGMDEVLVKPIRLRELAAVLGQHSAKVDVVAELNEEGRAWLQQDRENFLSACDVLDYENMRYYAHRMRGVALLYHIDGLADLTTAIETRLQLKMPIEDGQILQWRTEVSVYQLNR